MIKDVRFKAPTLIDERSTTPAIRLAELTGESVDDAMIDALVDSLVGQIGARIVARAVTASQRTWALDYSGHNLRLVFESGELRIEPEFDNAGCAIHDLHELFAIRSSPDGY